jgi:hypothetical protein
MLHSTYVGHYFHLGLKTQGSKAQLFTPVKDLAPTAVAAGTIVDDPPLVDHPLVVSTANVSDEEAAVETYLNIE